LNRKISNAYFVFKNLLLQAWPVMVLMIATAFLVVIMVYNHDEVARRGRNEELLVSRLMEAELKIQVLQKQIDGIIIKLVRGIA
jgi:hypothetical protein